MYSRQFNIISLLFHSVFGIIWCFR